MIIHVKIIPKAKVEGIEKNGDTLIVRVREPAENNRANLSVIKALTKYYGRHVRMISGFRSRRKIIEIPEK